MLFITFTANQSNAKQIGIDLLREGDIWTPRDISYMYTGAMSPADMERLVTTMKPERTDVLYTAVTSMMSHNCKDTYCGGVSGKCKGVFQNQSEANLLSIIMVELK
ncbi:unnamed protein product [Ambrosiozyma monospora]|uniref:Unnamed protein product n=1 Tax=Ambrosiozyma monospora TaxID=43982 RepID=A0ACB5SR82_AMBMO|nr:unnamed protein product [Ambrosiozyma monospora]